MTESAAIAIGARLKSIRAGQTQKDFAESLNIALATYQNYERGDRMPVADVVLAFYRLGWNANWILTGEGPERLEGLSNKALGVTDVGAVYQSQSVRLDRAILKRSTAILDLAIEMAKVTVSQPLYAEFLADVYEHLVATEVEADAFVAITRELMEKLSQIQGAANGRAGPTTDKEISRNTEPTHRK